MATDWAYIMNKKVEMSGLRIAVADDHQLVLEGFGSLLARNGMQRVELFRCAADLLESQRRQAYDLYIVDLELPDMDGFDLILSIRRIQPDATIVVNTIHDELWTIRRLVANGVNGILFKSLDSLHIIEAIRAVVAGRRYYCLEVMEAIQMMEDCGMEHPSQREMEVLRAIADGKTSKEIAEKLFISLNTVEAHRKSLFTKMRVRNTADLLMKAIRRGYLE